MSSLCFVARRNWTMRDLAADAAAPLANGRATQPDLPSGRALPPRPLSAVRGLCNRLASHHSRTMVLAGCRKSSRLAASSCRRARQPLQAGVGGGRRRSVPGSDRWPYGASRRSRPNDAAREPARFAAATARVGREQLFQAGRGESRPIIRQTHRPAWRSRSTARSRQLPAGTSATVRRERLGAVLR